MESPGKKRKKQGNVTRLAILIAIGFHVLLYLALRVTGVDEIIRDKIVEIVQAAAAPPPPPPPPPPPTTRLNAPPATDMNKFSVNTMQRMDIKDGFNSSMLSNFSSSDGAIDLGPAAMSLSGNDLSVMVSNSQLAPLALGNSIGFEIGGNDQEGKKGAVAGQGKRITGKTALAVLDLGGDSKIDPWKDGELENIAEYISQNTNLKVELGARAVSFTDQYSSFDAWMKAGMSRALSSRNKEISEKTAESDALDLLSNSYPFLADKDYEKFKSKVKKTLIDYFNVRFSVKLAPEKGEWAKALEGKVTIEDYLKNEYLLGAEKAFLQVYNTAAPSGQEIRGIYNFLRISEIMQLPILFCDPRGVPDVLIPENERFLRTYVNNGGFIYFLTGSGKDTTKTSSFAKAMGIRGLIYHLIQEKIDDPVGNKTLAELRKGDKEISGYTFRNPDPEIFHPWAFFPMIIPRQTNVAITIFNKIGNVVYYDTLKNILPGAYLQKNRHYKWHGVDMQNNEVESGYYIYCIESDLCKKTGPMRVSRLRKLPNGKHGIFSSFFNVSEVPTKESIKPSDLPYGEMGVFGVTFKGGNLAIVYTEGYKEKSVLGKSNKDVAAEEAALKWVTNIVVYSLSQSVLAR